MKSVPLTAYPRTLTRRGGTKKLRAAGRIPAVIYGGKTKPQNLEVDRKANKLEIKQAVEQLFGKTVIAVRTANYDGKLKRQRRADAGRTNHWKKAIVRLKEGESLDLV